MDSFVRSGTYLLHTAMHTLHLVSEDDDNSMCSRDTKIVINVCVLGD